MQSSNFLTVLFIAGILLTGACKQGSDNSTSEDELISTEVIQNPKTGEQGEESNSTALPVMLFTEDKHDFGDIIQGEKVEHSFKFTNTGDAPLVISNAKGSCGCTVPKWPEKPIAAGQSDFIRVIYDSGGRKNKFNKEVTITANTVPNQNKLYISGQVIVPQQN